MTKRAQIKAYYDAESKKRGYGLVLGFVLASPITGKDIPQHRKVFFMTKETLRENAKLLGYEIINEGCPLKGYYP